jgi:hypothetical protein
MSWPRQIFNHLNFYFMQKLSIRKISILGLVLMAASAVTAAVIPSKADKKDVKKFADGSLTQISESPNGSAQASSMTCEAATDGDVAHACNISDSNTTGQGAGSASVSSADGDNDANVGQDNTTSTE